MIEPIRINDNLIYFYWGRHPSHANMDMRLGGGCHGPLETINPLS